MMNPDDRPVNVRTSASARDFWSRPRVQGECPGDVSPDGKVVSQEPRSFSVLQDMPRTAPFQIQRAPQRHLPPLRNSRSIERLVYKSALQDAENIDPQPLLEIERLRRENQLLKNQYPNRCHRRVAISAPFPLMGLRYIGRHVGDIPVIRIMDSCTCLCRSPTP